VLSFSGRSTSLDSLFFATSGYSSFNTEGIFNGHSKINSLDYFLGVGSKIEGNAPRATDLQSSLDVKCVPGHILVFQKKGGQNTTMIIV
jgi:hypothetical protein